MSDETALPTDLIEDEEYDDLTVDEVRDAVDEAGLSPDEIQRVIDYERATQDRVTLLKALERRVPDEADTEDAADESDAAEADTAADDDADTEETDADSEVADAEDAEVGDADAESESESESVDADVGDADTDADADATVSDEPAIDPGGHDPPSEVAVRVYNPPVYVEGNWLEEKKIHRIPYTSRIGQIDSLSNEFDLIDYFDENGDPIEAENVDV